jgi:hypothetical protein
LPIATFRSSIRASLVRLTVALAPAATVACAGETRTETRFESLAPESTGVTFVNRLPEAADLNILHYLYYYNGGGVAVGDVDGDGRVDLYFSSNLEPNRLYRNLGGYRFADVTDQAGVAGPPGWKTGVAMADVNGDGWLDIYVSAISHLGLRGRNVLYVNDGDGTFTDRTSAYGLDYEGYATQVAFLDYDLDGDLDLYLLTHSTHAERAIDDPAKTRARHPSAGDRLLRNDGSRFTDVSEQAGILGGVDFGLGVVASDLNRDGCPDLYIANDFQENDFLYINGCDGTFTESIKNLTAHTSRFSMGVDAADVNNDGWPDLVVADMLPEQEAILKTSASYESATLFDLRLRAGYHPQYARNTLQLNTGHDGGAVRFSDVGYLAGVHATDWSWAPLLADFDNDGDKDLFVSNGILRRPNDLDYINYVGNDEVQASLAKGISTDQLSLLQRMPSVPLSSFAFRNDGNLTFAQVSDRWGLDQPGFANGVAYADLDNTGSLDLVVNRVNAPAAIYRNRGRDEGGGRGQGGGGAPGHYLRIVLKGEGGNTAGFGASVIVVQSGQRQWIEQSPTRGFQSSVDPRLHIGVRSPTDIDTVMVIWPDRRFQVLTGVDADREITLRQADAGGRFTLGEGSRAPVIQVVTNDVGAGVRYRHAENTFRDYDREPLMPHLISREGPALAVGDVNGDSLDDVYVGGAKWQRGALLVQSRDGRFEERVVPALAADSLHEDVDAAYFDADGDGDLDLYVVSAGNEFWGEAEALRDRLYVNDGSGRFTRAPAGALPSRFANGSCAAPHDFDGDGDIDLFVGARVVARAYGTTPPSALLRNDGTGRFVDVTAQLAPELGGVGMVTDAAWVDTDGDGRRELVVVGEWMPVRVFAWRGPAGSEVLGDASERSGMRGTEGWWNTIGVTDLNADGRPDLLLGNLGLNSYVRASPSEPARLFVSDFDGNGVVEQILTFYKKGVSYPIAGRDELVRLMPSLRGRYPSYAAFGASTAEQIFGATALARATVREARTLASSVALNEGSGRFTVRPLPIEAQFAPIYASVADDLDGDGLEDIFVAGNFSGVAPLRGRYDASRGLLLRGDGRGALRSAMGGEAGVEGEVRAMRLARHASGSRLIVVARNNDGLVFLRRASGRE